MRHFWMALVMMALIGGVAWAGDLEKAQAELMANPQAMAEIQQLAQDPEIVELLSDPALMQAAMAKDMAALQSNPRMMALMNNPKFQELINRLRAAQEGTQVPGLRSAATK